MNPTNKLDRSCINQEFYDFAQAKECQIVVQKDGDEPHRVSTFRRFDRGTAQTIEYFKVTRFHDCYRNALFPAARADDAKICADSMSQLRDDTPYRVIDDAHNDVYSVQEED